MSGVERLAGLAAREEAAVASRRWTELLEIQDEQRAVLDALPRELPSGAQPVLELALSRIGTTQRALFAALAETKGTIERLRSGRRAVGAYATRSRSGLETEA
jgi:hypothetical protein